jgi:hypothetical protein
VPFADTTLCGSSARVTCCGCSLAFSPCIPGNNRRSLLSAGPPECCHYRRSCAARFYCCCCCCSVAASPCVPRCHLKGLPDAQPLLLPRWHRLALLPPAAASPARHLQHAPRDAHYAICSEERNGLLQRFIWLWRCIVTPWQRLQSAQCTVCSLGCCRTVEFGSCTARRLCSDSAQFWSLGINQLQKQMLYRIRCG